MVKWYSKLKSRVTITVSGTYLGLKSDPEKWEGGKSTLEKAQLSYFDKCRVENVIKFPLEAEFL